MRRYVTILFAGLAGYLAYPIAPPWLGPDDDVPRITSRGWSELEHPPHEHRDARHGQPSRRDAVAALRHRRAGRFFAVTRLRSPFRWLLLVYPVAMGLALCYFGEHYVLDEAMGVALAGFVMLGWHVSEQGRAVRGQGEREPVRGAAAREG